MKVTPIDELVTHIIRCYTSTEHECIEFAVYSLEEAGWLAKVLFCSVQVYKVHVFEIKNGHKVLELI